MFALLSWCPDCRTDTEFDLVSDTITDTMTDAERSAEYACRDCGAAILVPRVTTAWAESVDRRPLHQVA